MRPSSEGERLEGDGRLPRTQGGDLKAGPPQLHQAIGPRLEAGERHAQHGAHRGPNGLAIEGVAAAWTQQDRGDAEGGRIAKDAADVVGVGHTFENDDDTGVTQQIGPRRRDGAVHERQTTAMKVETGQGGERGRVAHEHRTLHDTGLECRSQGVERLLIEEAGMNAVPRVCEDASHDEAPLCDEQAARPQQLSVGDRLVQVQPGVLQRGYWPGIHHQCVWPGYVTIDPRLMKALAAALFAALLLWAAPANAHPTPFSYLDIRVSGSASDVDLVAHIIDIAHDLQIEPPERLFEAETLRARRDDITTLLASRMRLFADGRALVVASWSAPEAITDRQSLKISGRASFAVRPGTIRLDARMFPYDPQHQTFVNFYEDETLSLQAILDASKTSVEFFSGTRQGVWAVVRKFVPSGVEHILIGPDHLLFLVGLLLLGGTLRQLTLVVSAFTVAHSITLSLAALNLLNPPARIIEPAIALSIIYVGADNLMVRDGKDVRAWIAFGFGFIHGFGFANVLREMDLPRTALGWSLFSFNLGVEIGQLLVVVVVASVLGFVRARSEVAGRRLAVAGSIAVIVAGTFWFIQRVFFAGGLT